MHIEKRSLLPPSLTELAHQLAPFLSANFTHAAVTVAPCPDLRKAPFYLACEGLSGNAKIADIGGQPNLFPRPRLDSIWAMDEVAKAMEMSPEKGGLIGAGAGPFHILGQNSELAPNLGWRDGLDNIINETRLIKILPGTGRVRVEKSPSLDCGLMANLYGSLGRTGPVIKITASGRKGDEQSFTECIRMALRAAYGNERQVSLGGVFLVKSGRAVYHVMPDFPEEKNLPFKDRSDVDNWLTWHTFDAPVVCLSVFHSADPHNLNLRMEHTHCFSGEGQHVGGHYHYEAEGSAEAIEYEGYFHTAEAIYRIDAPAELGAAGA
ncbi:Ester hydrolase C11orf54-like protein [Colletotrichum sidae]|uniref:Ester hydrolase C11orf54-like protein n=1 Tax=Colletotrichum sidae TaxID=1347389 RepID=A0A4R8TVK4_9PEZI|nr:Ester hydrolase C11orf54-like protein [Colletotrichum sidae]